MVHRHTHTLNTCNWRHKKNKIDHLSWSADNETPTAPACKSLTLKSKKWTMIYGRMDNGNGQLACRTDGRTDIQMPNGHNSHFYTDDLQFKSQNHALTLNLANTVHPNIKHKTKWPIWKWSAFHITTDRQDSVAKLEIISSSHVKY